MRIDKLFVVGALFVGALSLASCSDDDDYTPGAAAGANDVTFQSYSNPVMAKTATTFNVVLNRHTTSGTLTVPVEKISVPDGWTVPESADFAAGDSLTTISVTPSSDMKLNTDYDFVIRIPESYTNSYKKNNGEVNTYKVVVVKEDYETFATGTYDEEFFNGAQWPVTIEYSPALDVYRVKSMFEAVQDVSGYNFYFKWNKETGDKQEFYMVNSDGSKASKVQAGFTYGTYGMVYYAWAAATNDESKYADGNENAFGGYLSASKMFVLFWTHTVSAGSFGDGTDFIKDVKFVNN